MYFISGSNLSNISILFSYMVNTSPPLTTNLASRGNAPLQNVSIPSFLNIDTAHRAVLPYTFFASMLCMRVLTVSSGCVTATVMSPASPPIVNVATVPSFSPGAVQDWASCLRDV